MKVYSPEFKVDEVAPHLSDPTHTFECIGKDLGISRETLGDWVWAAGGPPDRSDRRRRGKDDTPDTENGPRPPGRPHTGISPTGPSHRHPGRTRPG